MLELVEQPTSAFSLEIAWFLARVSELANQNEIIILDSASAMGFDECQVFSFNDTRGFIMANSQFVTMAFSNTDRMADWLMNLDTTPVERPYGTVNKALYDGVKDVESQIVPILKDIAQDKKVWLTGHGLGGALAIIASAELHDVVSIDGVYTFGNPKCGKVDFQQFCAEVLPGKIHRFENDDDIVSRVTPGYNHVGHLLWFDEHGQLKDEDLNGPEIEASAPPDLTEKEFDQLQEGMVRLNELYETEEDPTSSLDVSMEGIVPGVSRHHIKRYITNIRNALGHTEVDDFIPHQALAQSGSGAFESFGSSSEASVPVLLRVNSPAWEDTTGIEIQSRLGTIITARATLSEIEQLKEDEGVVSIDASREGGIYDSVDSVPFIKADAVHQVPIDERGDSAIVGIIDSGIDILHEAFLDDNGKTRILALWNQRTNVNPSPHDTDLARYSQTYGSLYLQSDIQDKIDNPVNLPSFFRDPGSIGNGGHGTHVASIAAGRAAGGFSGGVAPEAKIIVVIPKMKVSPGDPRSLGYSNSHVDALSFIRTTAEKAGLPVAVNVSLGMNAGAHDGSSTLEAAFDAFSGIGRDPGFVIVKSAGNERGFFGHAMAKAFPDALEEISWESRAKHRNMDYIEMWFSEFDDIEFTLVDPANKRSETVSKDKQKVSSKLSGNICNLDLTRFHKDNGANRLVITILPDDDAIQAGEWTLEIKGITVHDGKIHAWVERDRHRSVNFKTGDNNEMILSIPGTAQTVITVSACRSSLPVKLTDSSSYGLTRDGRPKPDICAPGRSIQAALSNRANHKATIAKTGTSMAAPHVAGTIALLFSRLHKDPNKRQVNAKQVQSALARTTQNFRGAHHPGFGYGVLDALEFIEQF